MHVRDTLPLLGETYQQWTEAKAPRLGAALAFYTVISLAPLMIFLLALAGRIYGPQAAAGELVEEIRGTVGEPVAKVVQDMVRNADQPGSGVLATILAVVVLLFGASGVFVGLQDALNTIWRVAPKPDRWLLGMIRDRFFSIVLVLGTGFLLLVSLVLTSVIDVLGHLWVPPSQLGGWPWVVLNAAVSFAVITLLFALIFKYLPDAKVRWSDVWVGAIGTALLFNVGKHLLSLYLTYAGGASAYGAAGSLVVLLLWVYYSSQILLFGATFTRVYAQKYGEGIKPTENAMLLGPTEMAREGAVLRKPSEGQKITT
jgi:membrane protein